MELKDLIQLDAGAAIDWIIDNWDEYELKRKQNPQTAEAVVPLNDLLCGRTIEACAELLDKEADRQERVWNDFVKSKTKGHATSYHTIPRAYAEMIRRLAV